MAKFYELSRLDRIKLLEQDAVISAQAAAQLRAQALLSETSASHLTENQVSQFPLPMGVVHHLTVNGVMREVAIVGEEPSVVAAASNGARMAAAGGGVTATAPVSHQIEAQIVYVGDESCLTQIKLALPELPRVAQAAHPSIVARGGGLQHTSVARREQFIVVTLQVDVQEAMGANIVNTIAEACAHYLSTVTSCQSLFAILTNASDQVTVAKVAIPHAALATKTMTGQTIAARIALASDFARLDVSRATTHNKGIMNGIAGAALALGNDTRALEASVHAYAAQRGQYAPLSTWRDDGQLLHGEIALPLTVGTVGGAISVLPLARVSQQLAKIETVRDEQEVLAALGLMQNLAALRALVGPGIQAGHMSLAAGALAIAAGARDDEVTLLTKQLQGSPKTLAAAKMLLTEMRRKRKE